MTATQMSGLSVDDILNDLERLQQIDSSSSTSSSKQHPLLSLGNSLLPAKLQSHEQQKSTNLADSYESTPSLDDLNKALVASDQSQGAALHLSSVYLDTTQRTLALNHDRLRQDSSDHNREETSGLFDDLHRRVAKLQSSNEGYINRLEEIRHVVASRQTDVS